MSRSISRNVDIDDLVARYGGDVRRDSKRTELPAERWASVRAENRRGWGVGALVEHEGSVLLVREGDQWCLPGGTLEAGETHAEGAVREVREETGIDTEIATLLAITERTFVNAADGREFGFRFATFRGIPATTEPAADPGLDGEAIEAASWHDTIPVDTFDRDLVATLRG